MSTALQPVITNQGITALIDADNRGIAAKITHVAVGDGAKGGSSGPYVPTAEATGLRHEIQRSIVAGGELFGLKQNQLHLTATIRDEGDKVPDVYPIYEIGFYLDTGELFAVYASPEDKLAEKVAGTDFVLAFDLMLTGTLAENVVVDGSGALDLPAIRDNVLVGPNTYKIHTQAEFDQLFNQGADTPIPAHATIVLSPIQPASDGTDEPVTAYNGRPAYQLKNSVLINRNVSIIAFNPADTLVVKGAPDARIGIHGTEQEPVTDVRFSGWTFDGRGGVDELGGEFVSAEDGGAITLSHAQRCQLDCVLVNHASEKNGGAIFGAAGVSDITANHVRHCSAGGSGGGVFGCPQSIFTISHCHAGTIGSGLASCLECVVHLQGCDAAESPQGVIQTRRGNLAVGTVPSAHPFSLKGNGGMGAVGITQNQFGGTHTMELTTADAGSEQASRVCLRGGSDNARIELLQGKRGEEQVAMMVDDQGDVSVAKRLHVGETMTVAGRKPFAYRRYKNKGDNLNYNTGVSSDLYIGAVAGHSLAGGDIHDARNIGKCYLYINNGKWHIRADMPSSNNNHENWSVDVVYTLRSLFDEESSNQPDSLE